MKLFLFKILAQPFLKVEKEYKKKSLNNVAYMEDSKINTYLGQKGYTIPKNEISIEKQNQIHVLLT